MTRFIKKRTDASNTPPKVRKEDKVTRIEVINHAKNEHPIGRIVKLFKETNDFNSIEISYQDGGKTLKIFID